ncbi:MAG: hydantoinase B/oxoprolinase family protein [Dehalococcoidia bacterium]|nr:hydantoinase B/oxoprolinase family protein [Dehalococcoidia bacterium]
MTDDPARLAVWNALLASAAEEMGVTLWRTSHSPNIRERRDFSCAVFDANGEMVAQAAHIPVHLGAMPESIAAVSTLAPWSEGDVAIVNDPYLGGTHLPDVTLVAPVFAGGELIGFVANRAHHADIGGMSAGSMPVATELYQEGVIIPPLKLREAGRLNEALFALILRNVRTPAERRGDFDAQLGALSTGAARLQALATRYGNDELARWMTALTDYAERLTRAALAEVPDGDYTAEDVMEGADGTLLLICARVSISGGEVTVDFSGSAEEQPASINAVAAVTRSAVAYCVRCLLPPDAPSNAGVFRPIEVVLPEGSIVNARPQRAVSAGNVETSQRVTDVVLAAFAQALPERIPAASAGTMSNFTFGGMRPDGEPFAYYETVPGGAGAGPEGDGESGVQTHMTNTANTPAESIENAFPVRVRRFELRDGSGGTGRHRGGDGVVREIEFLTEVDVSLIGDRRAVGPPGTQGGEAAEHGENTLIRANGDREPLAGQQQLRVAAGERVEVHTPGGGGWGKDAHG